MIRFFIAAAFAFMVIPAFSQKKKAPKPAVLFSVGNEKITADEFTYLYRKNHPSRADNTDQKIEEYLSLFINFKLKVAEARSRGTDKTPEFEKEFNTYKDELRKPYLPEGKIVDSLVKLTYERLQKDVSASHILIEVKPDATPQDTLKAYQTAQTIKQQVIAGEDFGTQAALYSDDPSAKTNKGFLGYFTALQMVYPFEEAVYTHKANDVVGPVRTRFGYHIIKVGESQPTHGEVEVSHIMVRPGQRDEKKTRELIFEIREKLRTGAKWEDLVKTYSDDQGSRVNGGKLRPFGVSISSQIPEFYEVAFKLQQPGEISEPFTTAYGWHIIRLERKIPLPSFEESTPSLKNRVVRDERVQISKQALSDKLKKDLAFTENQAVKEKVLALADSSLTKGKWKIPASFSSGKEVLLSVQSKKITALDFLKYVQENQQAGTARPAAAMKSLYEKFAEAAIHEAFENKLVATNPDYAMLLREYYEGILLFDIMEKEVWKKASDDSAGQQAFYQNHAHLFGANERVAATIYQANTKEVAEKLNKHLAAKDSAALQSFVQTNKIRFENGEYQREDHPALTTVEWKPGLYTTENGGDFYVVTVSSIVPAGTLSFENARASVISEYQNELEKNWLTALRKKFKVKVNDKTKKDVFEKLKS